MKEKKKGAKRWIWLGGLVVLVIGLVVLIIVLKFIGAVIVSGRMR